MVQERVDSAEAVWRHFGFDGGEGGGSGVQQRGRGVRMSLPAFKHLLGCVGALIMRFPLSTPAHCDLASPARAWEFIHVILDVCLKASILREKSQKH